MNKKKKIIILICTILLSIFSIICICDIAYLNHQIKKLEKQKIVLYDTTYNHIVLDSISYNIIKKDSIITNYKYQLEYEKQQNQSSNASDAIDLFHKLLQSK